MCDCVDLWCVWGMCVCNFVCMGLCVCECGWVSVTDCVGVGVCVDMCVSGVCGWVFYNYANFFVRNLVSGLALHC